MRRGLTAIIGTLALGGTLAKEACGAPPRCAGSDRPWVGVTGSVVELPAIAELLRAELASRGIDLYPAADGCDRAPIATVAVSGSEQAARIVVEVSDRLTEKRVERQVDLAAVPADGRPLTLAVAAGELLRASWAELALTSAPPPRDAVPAAVEEALARDLAPSPRAQPTIGLGALGALDHWAGGTTLYGADLRATAWFTSRLAAVLRVGLREGSTVAAPDGDMHATAWVAGGGAVLRVTPWSRGGIDATARLDVVGVSYLPVPNPRAHGSAQTGFAPVAGAGAEGWAALGPSLRLVIEGLATVPLRPVRAVDAGREATSVSGIGVAGGLGVGVVL